MHYELRQYNNSIDLDEYWVIASGTLNEIAINLFENDNTDSINKKNVRLFVVVEQEINKSLIGGLLE